MFKTAIMMITLSFATQGLAQSNATLKADKKEDKPAAEARDSDKLDIRKLEQKYWSAKDDDFSVVQNRKYTKANRFFLNVAGGIPVNDPFSTGLLTSFQLGYFFNERLGVDVNYTMGNLKNNNSTTAFLDRFGSLPDYDVFSSSKMLSVTYVPLYAKMSFLDHSIIYFDMGFSVGVGSTDYIIKKQEGDETKSAGTYQWGVNQQIFFSEHFAVRIDLINRYANENKLKYTTTAPNRDQGTKNTNDTAFLLGVTYWH